VAGVGFGDEFNAEVAKDAKFAKKKSSAFGRLPQSEPQCAKRNDSSS